MFPINVFTFVILISKIENNIVVGELLKKETDKPENEKIENYNKLIFLKKG